MSSRVRTALLIFTALGLIASTYGVVRALPSAIGSDLRQRVRGQRVGQLPAGVDESIRQRAWRAGCGGRSDLVAARLHARRLRSEGSEIRDGVACRRLHLRARDARSRSVFYFAYISFFVLKTACLLCMTMYVSVIGTFLFSASVGRADRARCRRGLDATSRPSFKSPLAATLAVVWLAASAGLVFAFPKPPQATQTASSGAAQASPPVPVETLTPEQRTEWEAWLDAQPRAPEAMPTGSDQGAACSSSTTISARRAVSRGCSTRTSSRNTRRRTPASSCSRIKDFPLETECGAFSMPHAAACEAAAAVRMAREKNRDKELEAALFEKQSPSMTRDDVVADAAAGCADQQRGLRREVCQDARVGAGRCPARTEAWRAMARRPST